MLLECYLMEREILLAAGATQPITTNFMGPFKPADYRKWAPFMDVIADDCYPDPANPKQREFGWMTVHKYTPDRPVAYPFTDWKGLLESR